MAYSQPILGVHYEIAPHIINHDRVLFTPHVKLAPDNTQWLHLERVKKLIKYSIMLGYISKTNSCCGQSAPGHDNKK